MLIIDAVRTAIWLLEILIVIRALMSWFQPNPYAKPVQFINDITDPILGLVERFLPNALLFPMNFAPIVALLLLSLVERVLVRMLIALML